MGIRLNILFVAAKACTKGVERFAPTNLVSNYAQYDALMCVSMKQLSFYKKFFND